MRRRMKSTMGKRAWLLAGIVALLLVVWVVSGLFDSQIAEVIHRVTLASVIFIVLLVVLASREASQAARREHRALKKSLLNVAKQASSMNNAVNNGKLRRSAGLGAGKAVQLAGVLNESYSPDRHTAYEAEALRRLEAHAKHVLEVTLARANDDHNVRNTDRMKDEL